MYFAGYQKPDRIALPGLVIHHSMTTIIAPNLVQLQDCQCHWTIFMS